MKRMLLLLLVSTSCFGYKGWAPAYREVQVRDERDHYNEKENRRLREENERLQRQNNRADRVVYVRPSYEPNFEWITNSDKNMIKYGLLGIVICLLILRK